MNLDPEEVKKISVLRYFSIFIVIFGITEILVVVGYALIGSFHIHDLFLLLSGVVSLFYIAPLCYFVFKQQMGIEMDKDARDAQRGYCVLIFFMINVIILIENVIEARSISDNDLTIPIFQILPFYFILGIGLFLFLYNQYKSGKIIFKSLIGKSNSTNGNKHQ